MILITILTVGKCKEPWLEEALQEYVKRLRPNASLTWQLAKDDTHLLRLIEEHPKAIALDPVGKMFSSEEFSLFVQKQAIDGGSRIAFIIGGPDGLPQSTRESHPLVSFSKMTLTHQLARLILVEQLYRAFEIARGSPYHR